MNVQDNIAYACECVESKVNKDKKVQEMLDMFDLQALCPSQYWPIYL